MSDADRFASMDTQHDMCDEFPCVTCRRENNICLGCGDYLYDAKQGDCPSCKELWEALVKQAKERK